MKIKVCGMKYGNNIHAVSRLQPDYMGFIFHSGSPRYFEGSIPAISGGIKKTGVFVNASLQLMLNHCDRYGLHSMQLHGQESPDICSSIKEKGLEVIKVFSVGECFDFQKLEPYQKVVDYFLFDTKGKAPGGNGVTFNWDVLESYSSGLPFFLSGGLGPAELNGILAFFNSWKEKGKQHLIAGVDLNSKFESAPGMKKTKELKSFMLHLRREVAANDKINGNN